MFKAQEIEILTEALNCNLIILKKVNGENLENKTIVLKNIIKELRDLCNKVIGPKKG